MKARDDLEYAGFWVRMGASLIDSLLLLMIMVPVLLGVYGEFYFESTELVQGPVDFLMNYVFPAVMVICFWIIWSATPGKMAISATIVDAKTGGEPSVGQYVGRYFAYLLAALPLGLGLIWVAFDPRKQGWHDKLAGTVVVRPKQSGAVPVRFKAA